MITVLTVAGSDPSGGAGIQADLRTFTSLGVYGLAVVTALTAQNPSGVARIQEVPGSIIDAQLAVLKDIPFGAVKSGMLYSEEAVQVLAAALQRLPEIPYVLDPVISASDATLLLRDEARKGMIRDLIPRAAVITPNLAEASILSGLRVTSLQEMREAAKRIHHDLRSGYVLIKGGHLEDAADDLLYDGKGYRTFPGEKIPGKQIHGTGCVLSAAIAAGLAGGLDVPEAVSRAKAFVSRAIRNSRSLGPGADVLFDPPPLYK
ncbi:MAG: bifunctional hydroxymethylpyrimidine kinase/phosphomethylpyrimidine kinase [Nitrospirae bacterium]|nr:bifunctional hydroxymethylpyrimidine kinase/phosphomethylpyrimidine kinase [Nitrospirota bacterium]